MNSSPYVKCFRECLSSSRDKYRHLFSSLEIQQIDIINALEDNEILILSRLINRKSKWIRAESLINCFKLFPHIAFNNVEISLLSLIKSTCVIPFGKSFSAMDCWEILNECLIGPEIKALASKISIGSASSLSKEQCIQSIWKKCICQKIITGQTLIYLLPEKILEILRNCASKNTVDDLKVSNNLNLFTWPVVTVNSSFIRLIRRFQRLYHVCLNYSDWISGEGCSIERPVALDAPLLVAFRKMRFPRFDNDALLDQSSRVHFCPFSRDKTSITIQNYERKFFMMWESANELRVKYDMATAVSKVGNEDFSWSAASFLKHWEDRPTLIDSDVYDSNAVLDRIGIERFNYCQLFESVIQCVSQFDSCDLVESTFPFSRSGSKSNSPKKLDVIYVIDSDDDECDDSLNKECVEIENESSNIVDDIRLKPSAFARHILYYYVLQGRMTMRSALALIATLCLQAYHRYRVHVIKELWKSECTVVREYLYVLNAGTVLAAILHTEANEVLISSNDFVPLTNIGNDVNESLSLIEDAVLNYNVDDVVVGRDLQTPTSSIVYEIEDEPEEVLPSKEGVVGSLLKGAGENKDPMLSTVILIQLLSYSGIEFADFPSVPTRNKNLFMYTPYRRGKWFERLSINIERYLISQCLLIPEVSQNLALLNAAYLHEAINVDDTTQLGDFIPLCKKYVRVLSKLGLNENDIAKLGKVDIASARDVLGHFIISRFFDETNFSPGELCNYWKLDGRVQNGSGNVSILNDNHTQANNREFSEIANVSYLYSDFRLSLENGNLQKLITEYSVPTFFVSGKRFYSSDKEGTLIMQGPRFITAHDEVLSVEKFILHVLYNPAVYWNTKESDSADQIMIDVKTEEVEVEMIESKPKKRSRKNSQSPRASPIKANDVQPFDIISLSSIGECWQGWHCEGSLLRGVFVLMMWDVLYYDNSVSCQSKFESTVESDYFNGIFVSAYQDAPLDLNYPEMFLEKRYNLIEERLAKIKLMSHQDIISEIGDKYRVNYKCRSFGGMNWYYPLRIYQAVGLCIGGIRLSGLCKIFISNVRYFRSGMPDLLVIRASYVEDKDNIKTRRHCDLSNLIGENWSSALSNSSSTNSFFARFRKGDYREQVFKDLQGLSEPVVRNNTPSTAFKMRFDTFNDREADVEEEVKEDEVLNTEANDNKITPKQFECMEEDIVLLEKSCTDSTVVWSDFSYECMLVEVKSPTDHLQHKQSVWVQLLNHVGIKTMVCRVHEK